MPDLDLLTFGGFDLGCNTLSIVKFSLGISFFLGSLLLGEDALLRHLYPGHLHKGGRQWWGQGRGPVSQVDHHTATTMTKCVSA